GKTAQGNSTYNLVSDLTTGLTEGQKWVASNQQKSYLLATVNVEDSDPVCYESPGNNKLNLNDWNETSLCSGGSEGLYNYIEEQVPTTQTGGDGDPDVDKILPDPEDLFGNLEECPSRGQDYITDQCLTPSTLYSDPLTKKRYFYFSNASGKFFLKGFQEKQQNVSNGDADIQELFDGNRIDKISRIGDLEEWHLVNVTTAAHVFHIHQLDFVVTEVTLQAASNPCQANDQTCTYNNYTIGEYTSGVITYPGCEDNNNGTFTCPLLPQGYRDVINLPPSSTTTVRIPFVNPFITGPFVYHCHILNHEDKGMMNNLKVVNTKGYQGTEVVPQMAIE
ncbi:MAG: multicopper oxidase domain-containing protein, partial [Moorea sp. SIO4A3]|nr:multicopper oxidase domain-containing protein [Moorena sp. SIO4A3]